jgi:hypothetical protein
MTIQQIAKAYGISQSAVKKWPLAKRAAAIRELELGICPIIKRLCGEIAELCVVASAVSGHCVRFEPYYRPYAGSKGIFSIFYVQDSETVTHVCSAQDLAVNELVLAKNKLQELCDGL